jgi:hypothetical protein
MKTAISTPISSASAPSLVPPLSCSQRQWLRLAGFSLFGLLTIAPTVVQAIELPEAETPLHLVCEKAAEQLICQPDPAPAQASATGADFSSSHTQTTATIEPGFFSPDHQAMLSNWLLGLAYLLPIGLGLGIFLGDRYANYRAAIIKHQIEVLERIWQQAQQER